MRATFIKALLELAEKDPRIVLLTGDIGFTVLESFQDSFPDRFYNMGVAEQNIVGMATGLAEAGFLPFIYSIATFASRRPYEFIRNGPVLHNLPFALLVGGGFEYGSAGVTHYGLEDSRVNAGATEYAGYLLFPRIILKLDPPFGRRGTLRDRSITGWEKTIQHGCGS